MDKLFWYSACGDGGWRKRIRDKEHYQVTQTNEEDQKNEEDGDAIRVADWKLGRSLWMLRLVVAM